MHPVMIVQVIKSNVHPVMTVQVTKSNVHPVMTVQVIKSLLAVPESLKTKDKAVVLCIQ